ncbi:hypothetical protein SAMN05661080_01572 [Modestobacter sp. DSM 44400]|uniref:hypothetical protein n=1 Tax=Modestobacter sp. DSM 44400 TaxID=1550230 RepID=UPI00089B66F7|nr:hypothetical protein [Modestobacter sp. DSM 44400]SDX88094.1 hypothetical protein SAMN05661080_01572 [Modestobacter sp. DSM 44400]
MSAPLEDPTQAVLVPHWLAAVDRADVQRAVQAALDAPGLHPVVAIHLGDVLTELHVAAARELVWPAPILRVRQATGWGTDVVPVRLSAAELAGVLSLAELSPVARAALTGRRSA